MNFDELKIDIQKATTCNQSDGSFCIALTAAFSKSINFVCERQRFKELAISPFWLAPNLRSICEDLIVLGYVDKNQSNLRDETITLLLQLDFQNTIHVQKEFFDRFRPQQPIVRPAGSKNQIKKIKRRLKEINASVVKDTDSFVPTVRALAKDQGLLVLYDYLYNATSRLVHFSPGTLLRMAWGGEDGGLECKPDALDNYYSEFIQFYSAHLLTALVSRFQSHLNITENLQSAIDSELGDANSFIRWPELITFEEMNATNPWADQKTMRRMSFWDILIKDPGIVFAPQG